MPQSRNPDVHGAPDTIRQHHWIGDINVGLPTEGYVGARAIHFRTLRGFNKFFADKSDKDTPGMLLIKVLSVQPWLLGLCVAVTALVTNQLDPEEMAEMEEASRRIELEMKEWRQRRAMEKVEEAKVKAGAEEEVKRLARVGQHCEQNHKHNAPKRQPGDTAKGES